MAPWTLYLLRYAPELVCVKQLFILLGECLHGLLLLVHETFESFVVDGFHHGVRDVATSITLTRCVLDFKARVACSSLSLVVRGKWVGHSPAYVRCERVRDATIDLRQPVARSTEPECASLVGLLRA